MTESLDKQAARLAKKLNRISRVEVVRASSSAKNKAAALIKTRVARGLSKSLRIPRKFIAPRLRIKRSTARTNIAFFKAYVRPISIIKLLKPGVIASKAGGGTNRRGVRVAGRQFDGAFINLSNNGNYQVFKRKGRARYPLSAIKIAVEKEASQIVQVVAARIMENRYPDLLASDLNYRLTKIQERK